MIFQLHTIREVYQDLDAVAALKKLKFKFYEVGHCDTGITEWVITGNPCIKLDTTEQLADFIEFWGDVRISQDVSGLIMTLLETDNAPRYMDWYGG